MLRQVRERYGALPTELEVRLADAEGAMLDRVLARILHASTLEEFAADL